jgi:hypothetical protein
MDGPDEHPPAEQPAYPSNIKLYAITKRAIQKFCETITEEYMEKILTALRTGDFIKTDRQQLNRGALARLLNAYMRELDFLYTEQLLFNYKDYKGEPGQSIYDADLFVQDNSTESERDVITVLSEGEFNAKRYEYDMLFTLFKELSVRVLPPEDGSNLLPTPDELENELTRKREKYFENPP